MSDRLINEEQVIVDDTPAWPDVVAPADHAEATAESVRLVARTLAQRTASLRNGTIPQGEGFLERHNGEVQLTPLLIEELANGTSRLVTAGYAVGPLEG